MVILAMDLSLQFPAFAVLVVEGDKVRIKDLKYTDNKRFSKLSHGERLHKISKTMTEIINNNPDIQICVREKGFSRYASTTQALFKVVGVSDLVLFNKLGVTTIHEISPTSVKKYVTNDGKSSKCDVDREVRKYLVNDQVNYTFLTDDCSDAVAVGVAFLLHKNII